MKKTNNSVLSQYRGALMGISIILIIVFHFTEDCHYYEYHFNGWISFFWRYISSSSVDAFLFFSGLGLYYSMKKKPDVGRFYIRRLKRILIPYVIVAVPSYIVLDVCIDKTGWGEAIKDFSFITFFSEGDRLYWYIGLMLLCYLIYPYIFQIVDSARDAIDGEIRLLSIVSAITVLALVISLYEKEIFGNVNIALLRLPIFIVGCFYGRSSYEKRESYWKWAFFLVASGCLLTLLPSGSPIFSRYVTGIFNISCCAGMAWIFSKISMRPIIKILEWFGAHSLELYLVHVTIRKFMKKTTFYPCRLRYELVLVISAVVVSWLLHAFVRYISDRERRKS